MLRSQAAGLIVETHPQMVDLLRCVHAIDRVISWLDPPPEWDLAGVPARKVSSELARWEFLKLPPASLDRTPAHAIGCTGGKHRSVMLGEEVKKALAKRGYSAKAVHRDIDK